MVNSSIWIRTNYSTRESVIGMGYGDGMMGGWNGYGMMGGGSPLWGLLMLIFVVAAIAAVTLFAVWLIRRGPSAPGGAVRGGRRLVRSCAGASHRAILMTMSSGAASRPWKGNKTHAAQILESAAGHGSLDVTAQIIYYGS